MEMVWKKKSEGLEQVEVDENDPQEIERKSILAQKRVLRRYLRLKRNNFSKMHDNELTNEFYIQNFLPKFEQILKDNEKFLSSVKKEDNMIHISSYNPIAHEMNITPVMNQLIKNSKYNLVHSLPIVVQQHAPLVFRTFDEGDKLVKSELFSVFEPTPDKAETFPQVMIVPLMGFMDDCHRIGYGGGFYDRTIQCLKDIYDNKILMIGVAFEAQKFDRFTGQLAENDVWNEN